MRHEEIFELNKKDEQFLTYVCGLSTDEFLGVLRILNIKLVYTPEGETKPIAKEADALVCEAIEVFHDLPRKPRRQLLKLLKEATS